MNTDSVKTFCRGTYQAWRWLVMGLRWMAIVLFTLLFFVGLILRVPWKILLLLAVIPVVGIFVPQKVQKWVWGILTIVLIGVYVWILYLPEEDSSQWKTYRFETEVESPFL